MPKLYDIDGNGDCDALTDGLLIFRYVTRVRGESLIFGAIGVGATRTTVSDIEGYLETWWDKFDVGGDGQVGYGDALMILRFLFFGPVGDFLTSGCLSAGSIRNTPDEIHAYLTKMTT